MARQAVTVRYSTIAPTLAARANSRTRVIERDMQRFSRPNELANRRAAPALAKLKSRTGPSG